MIKRSDVYYFCVPQRGSHIVDKLLFFLIANMTLLGLVSSSCNSNGPVKGGTPRHQTILEDFDGDMQVGMAWHVPPSVVGSQAHLALASALEQVVHGKA